MLDRQVEIHDDLIFIVNEEKTAPPEHLRSLEWAILTQLNGERTVGEIGEILSLDPEETVHLFQRLLKLGAIVLSQLHQMDHVVPEDVFEDLEYQFTYSLGPVAGIVLEDALATLKHSRETLKKRDFPQLIELLSLEIANRQKRHEFQRHMVDKLKRLLT